MKCYIKLLHTQFSCIMVTHTINFVIITIWTDSCWIIVEFLRFTYPGSCPFKFNSLFRLIRLSILTESKFPFFRYNSLVILPLPTHLDHTFSSHYTRLW